MTRLSHAELAKLMAANPDVTLVTDGYRTDVVPKATQVPADSSPLEERFAALWQDAGGVRLEREVRFHPTRRWRFDFADVARKIAYEIQGGLYQAQSGHRSHDGVTRDFEKLNAAQLLGWRVFQITTYTMKDAEYMAELAQFHREQLPKEGQP